jgi:hydrogenase maturation protease
MSLNKKRFPQRTFQQAPTYQGYMKDLKYNVLVLGLGNLLMSDDGLGIHAAEGLRQKEWPPGVLIQEVGTSVLNYLEEIGSSSHVIAIDAVRAGGVPGSVYRITGQDMPGPPGGLRDAHGVSLSGAIDLARGITGLPASLVIFGVEPRNLGFGNQISPAVKKALLRVIKMITEEILKITEDSVTL